MAPPPRSEATSETTTSSSDQKVEDETPRTPAPSADGERKEAHDDDDGAIAALAKGLGDVSISSATVVPTAPKPKPKPKPPPKPLSTQQRPKEEFVPEEIRKVASLLASKKYSNIVVLTGAGVSCNAGIPDFRTPGTGLYDNLQKYNLPAPEAVFDLGFYRRNPDPFVQLASELWPGKHSPTITHSFIALLERKHMLLRTYTQNIDMLDVLAGVSEEKMIECHGHFRTASCINCGQSYDGEECKRIIVEEVRAPKCPACGGHVKPDIVFFGESLPTLYHRMIKKDMKAADLLIVMGTSLMVGPVNAIPDIVRKDCPRILFNNELVGSFCRTTGGKTKLTTRRKSYDDRHARRDIFHPGDCDRSVRMLCDALGWGRELDELNESTRLG